MVFVCACVCMCARIRLCIQGRGDKIRTLKSHARRKKGVEKNAVHFFSHVFATADRFNFCISQYRKSSFKVVGSQLLLERKAQKVQYINFMGRLRIAVANQIRNKKLIILADAQWNNPLYCFLTNLSVAFCQTETTTCIHSASSTKQKMQQ